MEIQYTVAREDQELRQILDLQQQNLSDHLSDSEKKTEGFVTVKHDFDLLKQMNIRQPHIIAVYHGEVIGYALCMTTSFKSEIKILEPMFKKIDLIVPKDQSYIIMGQICIAKRFRKHGVFKGLYYKMRAEIKDKYGLLITEVSTKNTRSLKAHVAIGFKNLENDTIKPANWHLISWDWS